MSNYDFDVITGPSAPPVRPLAARDSRPLADSDRFAALPDADAGTAPGRLAPAPLGGSGTGKIRPLGG